MLIRRAYRTELRPNQEQGRLLLKHAGTARFAYNWGLARQKAEYEKTGKRLSLGDLKKAWHREKPEWVAEVSTYCAQSALADLDRAYQNFFRRLKAGQKPGFPRFKSKKRGIGGSRLYGSIHVDVDRIQLPRIGSVKLKERDYLPTHGVKVLNASVHEKAGRWFVSLQVEMEVADPEERPGIVGLDLGLRSLLTLSTGEHIGNPKHLLKAERRLKRLQRSVSRKVKGSANRRKAVARLARAHYRVACARNDLLHQTSATITRRFGVVSLEDLHVKGMLRNHCLAKAIGDAGWSELRRQLEYKQAWTGGRVVVADRFFPSSKLCSECGTVKEKLSLSERIFRCACGNVMDRDENAARNLMLLAAGAERLPDARGSEAKDLEELVLV